MKNFILASILLSTSAFAQTHSKKELVDMTLEKLYPNGPSSKLKASVASDIIDEWNELFDRQILRRDLNRHRIDWKKLLPVTKSKVYQIKGKRVFYGLVPKSYHYNVIADKDTNSLTVQVKMHFYPSATYLKRMEKHWARHDADIKYYPQVPELMKQVRRNVEISENIWNSQTPAGVKFKFEMVDSAEEADYSLKLADMAGGLYDSYIMAPAPSSILAHEVGHMMGLDDEYSLVTSNVVPLHSLLHGDRTFEYTAYQDMRCNLESIMCLRETIYPYHFDHILGRIELE